MMLCALFIPTISSATPSIGNVGGNFNHGNTISITGSGFGTKNPAKPLVWAPFEGGAVDNDRALSSGSILSTANLSLSSSDLPHSRSRAAVRGIPYIASPYTKAGPQIWIAPDSSIVDMFIFLRRKYAHAKYWDESGVNNYKFYRFWPPNGTLHPDYVAVFANSKPRVTKFASEGAGSAGTVSGFIAPANAWYTEELQVHQGGIDTQDSTTKFWMNSVLKLSYSHISRTSKNPAQWSRLSIENFWTLRPPPSGAYMYFDDIYVDTTWSRVMIGNASTFDACTVREPLIPTAWSNTTITAYFNQGSFSNGQSVYVFVVDSDGNASSGKAITIGGAAPVVGPPPDAPPAPSPPTYLKIN